MLYLKSNVVKKKILRALTYSHATQTQRDRQSPGKHRRPLLGKKKTQNRTQSDEESQPQSYNMN